MPPAPRAVLVVSFGFPRFSNGRLNAAVPGDHDAVNQFRHDLAWHLARFLDNLIQCYWHGASLAHTVNVDKGEAEKSESVGWSEFIQVAELFVAGQGFPRGIVQVVCGHRLGNAFGVIQQRLGHEVVQTLENEVADFAVMDAVRVVALAIRTVVPFMARDFAVPAGGRPQGLRPDLPRQGQLEQDAAVHPSRAARHA